MVSGSKRERGVNNEKLARREGFLLRASQTDAVHSRPALSVSVSVSGAGVSLKFAHLGGEEEFSPGDLMLNIGHGSAWNGKLCSGKEQWKEEDVVVRLSNPSQPPNVLAPGTLPPYYS